MFSSRTDWDVRPSALFSLVQQKRAQGEIILDLTESNPTRCGFRYQPEHLFDAKAIEQSVAYEPDPKGMQPARQSIARWYEQRHININPNHIVLTSGTSEAYSFLFRLLCNGDESAAIPAPTYPLFDYLCQLNDVKCRHYHLAYDGEWHLDDSRLEAVLALDTRALVLIHPNNPTGSFIKKEERERVVSLAKRKRIPLIVDEVFHTYGFKENPRRAESFAGVTETLTFTVNGLSKLVGLPQMKLAWIVVSGPVEDRTQAVQRLEIIADTYLSVGTHVQHALDKLLNDSVGIGTEILKRVRTNYQILSETCGAPSPVSLLQSEGGWNAVLRLPATKPDGEWALQLLRDHNVLVHPGDLFDFDIKSCFVLSLLPAPETFREGVRRILSLDML